MISREGFARALAVTGAILTWAALALQFVLIVGQIGEPLLAAWRFLGFFTILTNLLVALVLSRAALGAGSPPRLDLATATAIAMVGLVYSLLLRATWRPEGAQKIADVLLHDAAPLVFIAYFLIRPRPSLRLADAAFAMVFPLTYVVYALARGAADGWYAYWFLDPRRLTGAQLTLSILGLAVAFAAMGLFLAFCSNRANARASSGR